MANHHDKDSMSTGSLHRRLQIVEIVVFVSLMLNVIQGYLTIHNHKQVVQLQEQTGQR